MRITKGECERRRILSSDRVVAVSEPSQMYNRKGDKLGLSENEITIVDFPISRTSEGNANLIAEAFNVANETGKTPRQLVDQNKELLEVLKKALPILKGDGCSTIQYQSAESVIKKATE